MATSWRVESPTSTRARVWPGTRMAARERTAASAAIPCWARSSDRAGSTRGVPLQVSLHAGGVALAVPARLRGLLVAPRVRPDDPVELARQAGLYAMGMEAARGLADL